MEDVTLYISTSISFLFLFLAYRFHHSKTSHRNLPPSPPSLPILGHLHLFKPPIHRVFHNLSQKYGPIVALRLGCRLVVVVSSPSAVEECFTKNDIILANRPRFILSNYINYNNNNIISAPYGGHWRNVRRIGTVEILTTNRLNVFLSSRKDEIKRLLCDLSRQCCQEHFIKVGLQPILSNVAFNVIMRMVAGKRYHGDDVSNEEEARQFREIIEALFSYGGISNPEDFFPILRWINGGKLEKKLKKLAKKTDEFLQTLIDEHRQSKAEVLESTYTMIDRLLYLQETQPNEYSDEVIKGLMFIMLFAGTDTSAVTLEWTMSNLANHPHVLHKAKTELDAQIGQARLIEESDLPKLPYLQNIISETLRLYPAGPLLVPHYSSEDCVVGGYNVPKNTIVIVNAWAIHRDPTLWDDPTNFRPERFEAKGLCEGYKFVPFGMGRRACPGVGLAQRILGLTLGSLIQCFEWKNVGDKPTDMREGRGMSMPKAQPLEVMCKARPIMSRVLVEAP